MTVNELIKVLKTYPQDSEVRVRGRSNGTFERSIDVRTSTRVIKNKETVVLDGHWRRDCVEGCPYETWVLDRPQSGNT